MRVVFTGMTDQAEDRPMMRAATMQPSHDVPLGWGGDIRRLPSRGALDTCRKFRSGCNSAHSEIMQSSLDV
jgi:hypothetical protein